MACATTTTRRSMNNMGVWDSSTPPWRTPMPGDGLAGTDLPARAIATSTRAHTRMELGRELERLISSDQRLYCVVDGELTTSSLPIRQEGWSLQAGHIRSRASIPTCIF